MKKPFLVFATACVGLLMSSAPAPEDPGAPKGPVVTLTLVDMPKDISGALERMEKGIWKFGEWRVAESSTLAVYFPFRQDRSAAAGVAALEVILANGDRFRGTLKTITTRKVTIEGSPEDREFLTFDLKGVDPVAIMTDCIRAVLFGKNLEAIPPQKREEVLSWVLAADTAGQQKDLQVFDLGDVFDRDDREFIAPALLLKGTVPRTIRDPEDPSRTKEIQAPLLAVRFKFPAEPARDKARSVLTTHDGSQFTGTVRSVKDGKLEFQSALGFPLELPTGEIRQITYLHPNAAYLSDLPDPSITARRFLDAAGPVDALWTHFAKDHPAGPREASTLPLRIRNRAYPKGLGTHSYSRLEYPLPEGFSRFIADVGIDDHVLKAENPHLAGVVVRVFVDHQLRYESPFLTAASAVERIRIDIANAKKIELETDWQDRLQELLAKPDPVPPEEFFPQTDILDRVAWGHAVLVKSAK